MQIKILPIIQQGIFPAICKKFMNEKNLITLVILAAVGTAGYFIWQHQKATTPAPASGTVAGAQNQLQSAGITAAGNLAGSAISALSGDLAGLFSSSPSSPANPSYGSTYSQIGSGDDSYTLASDQQSSYNDSGDYTS